MTRAQLINTIRDAHDEMTASALKAICTAIKGTDLDIYRPDTNAKWAYLETITLLQMDIDSGAIAY